MKIYRIDEILAKLDNCIKSKIPFSHIRFGDGGIKFIHSLLYDDMRQLYIIVRKEGIPYNKVDEIFSLWGYYARHADFIDSPAIYHNFGGDFWPRMRTARKLLTAKTALKLEHWKTLYSCAEFDNENYCNPESNYLMIIRRDGKKNLLDLMQNRKTCIITAKPNVARFLQKYNVDIVEIVGHYQNQYVNSMEEVIRRIKVDAKKYDFWLVAAGELGRIYSGLIKQSGGRTVDVGFVVEFWLGENLHPRLLPFLRRSCNNHLELVLTKAGKKFEDSI